MQRLHGTDDRLVAEEIFAAVSGDNFLREIIVLKTTNSTNDAVKKLGHDGALAGVALFAEEQTAGRGRLGRHWLSQPGQGLWFSILLRPKVSFEQWTRLTTWAAVAVARALYGCGVTPSIKWPNDIFLDGKKVAGILIETSTDAAGNPFAIAGIGVNTNQRAFPPPLNETATSLRMSSGDFFNRQTVAIKILQNLSQLYSRLGDGFFELVAEAESRSCLIGRWLKTGSSGSEIEGIAERLDADGALIVRKADGSVVSLRSGEVTVLAF